MVSRRDLLKSAVVGGAALALGRSLPASVLPAPSGQGFPFLARKGFLDIGVPVTANGDPGSSSLVSSVGEPGLGFVFDVLQSFTLETACIAMGISGGAWLRCSVYRLDRRTLARVEQVFSTRLQTSGVASFNLLSRIRGTNEPDHTGDWTWYWFDVPVNLPVSPGHPLELVFSDFAIASGVPVRDDWSNWLYSHPFYDLEGRAHAQPYDVGGLIEVFDGSIRGVSRGNRFAYVPMALMRARR